MGVLRADAGPGYSGSVCKDPGGCAPVVDVAGGLLSPAEFLAQACAGEGAFLPAFPGPWGGGPPFPEGAGRAPGRDPLINGPAAACRQPLLLRVLGKVYCPLRVVSSLPLPTDAGSGVLSRAGSAPRPFRL